MPDSVSDTTTWSGAIVFDLDGTLVDSAPDIALAAEQALADYDLPIDANRVRAWIGDGSHTFIERALASIGIEADEATVDGLTQYSPSAMPRRLVVIRGCLSERPTRLHACESAASDLRSAPTNHTPSLPK